MRHRIGRKETLIPHALQLVLRLLVRLEKTCGEDSPLDVFDPDHPRFIHADRHRHSIPRWPSGAPAIACRTSTPCRFAPGRGTGAWYPRWPVVARPREALPGRRRRLGSKRPGWPRARNQRGRARTEAELSSWGSSFPDVMG